MATCPCVLWKGMGESCRLDMNDTIIKDKKAADEYDLQAHLTHWHAPEVVFGLAYEYVNAGESLLDLGIGSGLSSIPFHKAGLHIYGLDGSSEVLQVCAAKGFTVELTTHDLRNLPLPYASRSFDHVICVAVLNSFKELGPLFGDVSRIMKNQGIFAFTTEERKPGQDDHYAINPVEVSEKPDVETAVMLYRHGDVTISETLERSGFSPLKTLEFLAFKYPAENTDIYFKATVARKR
jgi:predicted TPR repeat methyltransferase